MARYFFSSIDRFDFHARTWVHFSEKLIFVQQKLLQNLKSKVVDRRFDNFYTGKSTLNGAFCFSNIKKGNFNEIKKDTVKGYSGSPAIVPPQQILI